MTERITLSQLRCFVAVAEHLHFARAAASLGIAQPPLSIQVQRLEKLLGSKLFLRGAGGVSLTPVGVALLPKALEVQRAIAAAAAEVRLVAAGQRGQLRIAYAGSLLYTTLPPIVARFRREWPGVTIELTESPSASQSELVQAGAIDIGFARDVAAGDGVTARPLLRERLVVAVPAGHRLAATKFVAPKTLAPEDFVLFARAEHPLLHDRILATLHSAGVTARIVQECEDWLTVIALVRAGLGISIVPDSFRSIGAGRVRFIPLRPVLASSVHLLLRRGEPSPAVKHFLAIALASDERQVGGLR